MADRVGEVGGRGLGGRRRLWSARCRSRRGCGSRERGRGRGRGGGRGRRWISLRRQRHDHMRVRLRGWLTSDIHQLREKLNLDWTVWRCSYRALIDQSSPARRSRDHRRIVIVDLSELLNNVVLEWSLRPCKSRRNEILEQQPIMAMFSNGQTTRLIYLGFHLQQPRSASMVECRLGLQVLYFPCGMVRLVTT